MNTIEKQGARLLTPDQVRKLESIDPKIIEDIGKTVGYMTTEFWNNIMCILNGSGIPIIQEKEEKEEIKQPVQAISVDEI